MISKCFPSFYSYSDMILMNNVLSVQVRPLQLSKRQQDQLVKDSIFFTFWLKEKIFFFLNWHWKNKILNKHFRVEFF